MGRSVTESSRRVCGNSASRIVPPQYFNAITITRWFFALSLVCFHGCIVAGHPLFFPVKGHAIVSVFFVLSGMLTYESFSAKPDVCAFYKRRIVKLYPAYAITVLLCALLLPVIFGLDLGEFFSSPGTWKHLGANLTFLNFLTPRLDGIFDSNLITTINSSLWTMKVEVMFYAVFPLLFMLMRKFRPIVVMPILYMLSVAYNIYFTSMYQATEIEKFDVIRRQLPGQMMYFVAGMMVVKYRAQILRHKYTELAAGVALWALCAVRPQFRPIEPLAIAIVVTVAGYGFRKISALSVKIPNLTYEIFLIHFPVMQTLTALGMPQSVGFAPFFITALTLTILLSFALQKASMLIIAKVK